MTGHLWRLYFVFEVIVPLMISWFSENAFHEMLQVFSEVARLSLFRCWKWSMKWPTAWVWNIRSCQSSTRVLLSTDIRSREIRETKQLRVDDTQEKNQANKENNSAISQIIFVRSTMIHPHPTLGGGVIAMGQRTILLHYLSGTCFSCIKKLTACNNDDFNVDFETEKLI